MLNISELKYTTFGGVKVYNLTPHMLNVLDRNGNITEFAPSGAVARVSTKEILVGRLGGLIEVNQRSFGEVDWGFELPEMKKDTIYIVSSLVASAIKGTRHDIMVPGNLVRNDQGQPIGCQGLAMV